MIRKTLALFALIALAGCNTMPAGAGPEGTAAIERAITLLQVQDTSTDPATRANCVEALQSCSDPRAAAVIEQGLHDPEWVVRFASAMAIARRKDTGYRTILNDLAAKDPNQSVRAAAIFAQRQIGDTANMSAIAGMLQSPDASVRANAAMILGLMGDRSAIGLLQSIRSESDPRVKFEITAALARLGNENAQRIITALALSRFAEDQWMAMIVCGDLPLTVASNPLLLGIQDPPSQTPQNLRPLTYRRQLVAARSLAKQGSAQGKTIALEHLTDSDPELRALAALVLGDLLSPSEIPTVSALLSDPSPAVQRAAAAAIVNIGARAAK